MSWPDIINHSVKERTGNGLSSWIVTSPKTGYAPILGAGGESTTFLMNVLYNGCTIPMALRSYSVSCKRIGEKVFVDDINPGRNPNEVKKFVARQLNGYAILHKANEFLRRQGLSLLPLPNTVRETISAKPESSILMTDLTNGGHRAMLEAKLVLATDNLDGVTYRLRKQWPNIDHTNRRVLAQLTIEQIQKHVELAKLCGITFQLPFDNKSRDLIHQFDSWSVLVTSPEVVDLCIHDFSSVKMIEQPEDTKDILEALKIVRSYWQS